MRRRASRNGVLLWLLSALALPATQADVKDFTLAKAIPADSFLAVHTRGHAGQEFLKKQGQRVWDEVLAARFDRDLKKVFKAMTQPEATSQPASGPSAFDTQWQKLSDVCATIDWAQLAEREYAMAMKLGFPTTEWVSLMMPPADKVADNFAGLSGMLKMLVELAPDDLALSTEEADGSVVHKLSVTGAPFPIGVMLARHGDVILLAFGSTIGEQALAQLKGAGGKPLAESERFQAAVKQLPNPEDSLVFFDVAQFFTQMRGLLDQVLQMAAAGAPPEGTPERTDYDKAIKIPAKVLDALDMWEYVASSRSTKGMRTEETSISVLRDDAKSRGLYPAFYGNPPLESPLKYVPKDSGAFVASNGVNLQAAWRWALELIKNDVPQGEELLAGLKSFEQEAGLSIEADVLSWIEGSMISSSTAGPTPASPGTFAWLLRVRDEAKAREMLDRLWATVTPMLGQSATIADATIENTTGFKTVTSPQLAMLGSMKPTVGVKDGWLFIASNPTVVTSVLQTAAGGENFSANERFQKEGLAPESNVTAMSFTDLTGFAEQMATLLSMVPMVNMMAPDIARDPVASTVLTALGKSARVVRKFDFLQSSAAQATFDGKTTRAVTITNYREPPQPKKPAPPAGSSGGGSGG